MFIRKDGKDRMYAFLPKTANLFFPKNKCHVFFWEKNWRIKLLRRKIKTWSSFFKSCTSIFGHNEKSWRMTFEKTHCTPLPFTLNTNVKEFENLSHVIKASYHRWWNVLTFKLEVIITVFTVEYRRCNAELVPSLNFKFYILKCCNAVWRIWSQKRFTSPVTLSIASYHPISMLW